ncbi:hypothetical protein L484_019745 [Morus notabilis]|uniref:Uncharacterized protein n=1 Tax=Morus notabilis TaxID=981085 RepID=W9RDM1_9ROSA|nr:hypothetical protein L484_019745 [Morus notabilis]
MAKKAKRARGKETCQKSDQEEPPAAVCRNSSAGSSESNHLGNTSDTQSSKSFDCRCSPSRFANVCKALKGELAEVVAEMRISVEPEDGSLNVHGKTCALNPHMFEIVMGLKDGGEECEQEGYNVEDKMMREALFQGNKRVSIANSATAIRETETSDKLFIRRFLLL